VLRAPELDAGLPGGLSGAGQRGRIPSLALCPRCWGCSPGHSWLSGLRSYSCKHKQEERQTHIDSPEV